MNAISLLVTLLVGVALGAAIGFLLARGRLANVVADLTGRAQAADERASSAQQRAAMVERAAQEKAALLDGQLAERFQSLSVQALDQSARTFLQIAEGRLGAANAKAAGELDSRKAAVEHLVQPLQDMLARMEVQLRESDAARRSSHAALAEQVTVARQSSEQLRVQTQSLVTALRRPEARGRWGEMQLRRVVELAGMSARCDFDEQVSLSTPDGVVRPDMVVRLAGGKNIVVDSKVSLAAYLEAAETTDETIREARLDAHARHLRDHVDRLAAKAYWTARSPSPEFVVLFLPGDSFLSAAIESDPGIMDRAIDRKVLLATPMTLVALLKAVAYGWRQEAVSESAEEVSKLGRELSDRMATVLEHLGRVGSGLSSAVQNFNKAVGSFEQYLVPGARKFKALGAGGIKELDVPERVDVEVREVSRKI